MSPQDSSSLPGKNRLVLLTGATGFVGKHVARDLAAHGFRVRALVRSTSNLDPIADVITEARVGDLSQPHTLVGVCDGVDAVVHAGCAVAGTFDAGRAALDQFLAINRDGTAALAREVARHPGLRMVHISSTAAMGVPSASVVDESSPCHPTTPYQVSKRAAEEALLALHASEGLNVVMLRPCVIAGPGKSHSELLQLFRLVKRGVFPLLGGQVAARKPLIHILDLAQAIRLAIDRGPAGSIYFVHSGADHTLGEMLRATRTLAGVQRGWFDVPLPAARAAATLFGGVLRVAPNFNPPITHQRIDLFLTDRRISIERARRELGYTPTHTDVLEMLSETWDEFVARGVL